MKKWYNVELSTNTANMIERVEKFREWLYDNAIRHEISAAGLDLVNFEIELSTEQVADVTAELDRIVWYDAIWSVPFAEGRRPNRPEGKKYA